MKIGIMGGSFSPPHKGHLHAASKARDELGFDKIILIPAGNPPHKTLPEKTPEAHQRLEMARIAAKSIGAEVWDFEIMRKEKSYTAITLTELKKIYPNDELFFIMGTDMFLTVDSWYKPEIIYECATLCPVARDHGDLDAILKKAEEIAGCGARVKCITCEAFPASSTEIRDGIENKEHLLPQGVYEYILRENLYGIRG